MISDQHDKTDGRKLHSDNEVGTACRCPCWTWSCVSHYDDLGATLSVNERRPPSTRSPKTDIEYQRLGLTIHDIQLHFGWEILVEVASRGTHIVDYHWLDAWILYMWIGIYYSCNIKRTTVGYNASLGINSQASASQTGSPFPQPLLERIGRVGDSEVTSSRNGPLPTS